MRRPPRAIADIMTFSGGAAALVAQVRRQSILLASVKRELETSLHPHLVAALLRNKQLVLYADSSAWASRLRFVSRTLRGRLGNEGFDIEKITVRIALPSTSKHGSIRVARQLSQANSLLIAKTAETINDPALREALKRLSRHGR